MSNELQKNSSSNISEKLLSSLSDKERNSLAKYYTKEIINIHVNSQKKEINRFDVSDTIGKLTSKTREAMNHGAEIKISTTIRNENSETKVDLSDPSSANREGKLYLYVLAIIALIILVFLFK